MTRQDMQAIAQLRPLLSRASALPLPPAGYDLWLPATKNLSAYTQVNDGTGAPVADGPVGRWIDQSGNNYHANQATSTAKPTLKTNVLNGYPALRFDGGDYLDCGDVLDMLTNDFTLCVVGKASAAEQTYVSKSPAAGANGRYGILYSGAEVFGVYQGSSATVYNTSVARTPGNYEYLTQVVDRANTNTLYANGTQIAQNTTLTGDGASAENIVTFKVGAYTASDGTTPALYLTGDIVEVIAYRSADSATLTPLHAYMTAKFGL